MATATTAEVAAQLAETLTSLRADRDQHPDHETSCIHLGCTICTAQRRIDWLLDKLFPPNSEDHLF